MWLMLWLPIFFAIEFYTGLLQQVFSQNFENMTWPTELVIILVLYKIWKNSHPDNQIFASVSTP